MIELNFKEIRLDLKQGRLTILPINNIKPMYENEGYNEHLLYDVRVCMGYKEKIISIEGKKRIFIYPPEQYDIPFTKKSIIPRDMERLISEECENGKKIRSYCFNLIRVGKTTRYLTDEYTDFARIYYDIPLEFIDCDGRIKQEIKHQKEKLQKGKMKNEK